MGMEDDTRGFFVLIVNTISIIFIWMMSHVLLGIYFGLAFFEETPGWKNYLYYIVLLVSLFFVVRFIRRKWKI